jgi:hypothetical protein
MMDLRYAAETADERPESINKRPASVREPVTAVVVHVAVRVNQPLHDGKALAGRSV